MKDAPDTEELLEVLRGDGRIQLLGGSLSRPAMMGLNTLADVYVSLHRSEGFGLTMAEAMRLGKPVIATGYSGNLDFMTPFNSWLVDYQLVPLLNDVGPYPAGQCWAEANRDHAAELMTTFQQDYRNVQSRCARAIADLQMKLSPRTIGQQMRDRLQIVLPPQ